MVKGVMVNVLHMCMKNLEEKNRLVHKYEALRGTERQQECACKQLERLELGKERIFKQNIQQDKKKRDAERGILREKRVKRQIVFFFVRL